MLSVGGVALQELPEQAIARAYTQLEPQKRRPRAFWTIVVRALPSLRTEVKPPAASWADINAFLAGPQFYSLEFLNDGDDPDAVHWRDAAKVAQLALALVLSSRRKRPTCNQVEGLDPLPQFCAYCWRLGFSPQKRMGLRPAQRVKRDLAKHLEKSLASPVRCVLHGTMKAQAGYKFAVHTVRDGRSREQVLDQRERALIDADCRMHRDAPGKRFQISGINIITSGNTSDWTDFVRRTFPFAAFDSRFEGLSISPEKAFKILDDEENNYPGRKRVHDAMLSDRPKLALYLMPMLLRADVWVESEVRAKLKKAHDARMERYETLGRKGRKPRFKMPSRAEWAKAKAAGV